MMNWVSFFSQLNGVPLKGKTMLLFIKISLVIHNKTAVIYNMHDINFFSDFFS